MRGGGPGRGNSRSEGESRIEAWQTLTGLQVPPPGRVPPDCVCSSLLCLSPCH